MRETGKNSEVGEGVGRKAGGGGRERGSPPLPRATSPDASSLSALPTGTCSQGNILFILEPDWKISRSRELVVKGDPEDRPEPIR